MADPARQYNQQSPEEEKEIRPELIRGGGEGGPPSPRENFSVLPTTSPPATARDPSSEGQLAKEPASQLPQRQTSAAPTPPSPEDIQRMERGVGSQTAPGTPNYVPQTSGPNAGVRGPDDQTPLSGERQSPGGVILPQEGETRSQDQPEPVNVEGAKSPYDQPGYEPDEEPSAAEEPNPVAAKPSFMDRFRRNKKDTPSRDDLADREKTEAGKGSDRGSKAESDQVAGHRYKQDADADKQQSRFRTLFATRRRKLIGGGIAGTIIGIFFGFSILQGPFQFIHFAQLLRGFHITSQEDAGDGRMGRFYRFVRSGGDFGETRVGWLGSKYNKKIFADFEKIGLKPEFGGFKTFLGFTIDRKNPNSPYRNLNNTEVEAKLIEKGISKESISFRGNEVFVDAEKGYFKQTRALRAMISELGYGSISSAIRARPLQKYGLVTWHPLKRLDKKLNQKIAVLYENWRQAREDRLRTGIRDGTIDPEKARSLEIEYDQDGNLVEVERDISEPKGKTREIFNKIKSGGAIKAAGGVAAVAGAVCIVKDVNEHVGLIRKENIIDPLVRIGTWILTIGQQLMSGQDVDLDTLGFVKKNFDGVSTKGKWSGTGAQADVKKDKSTSAFDAASIQAESGQKQTGLDIDEGVKENINGPPPDWLSWADDRFSTLCSTTGMVIVGVVSAFIGVISGNTINTAVGIATSIVLTPIAVSKLADFVAGQSVNVAAVGAEFGNYANYGLRLAGNSIALMFGGTELSKEQEQALKEEVRQERLAEFQSQSLAYRLFNPYDPDTAISKLIDSSQPGISQNIASLTSFFINNGKSLFKIGDIFTSKAKAAENAYDYGFAKYGFSKEDLENPLVEDPYANADEAAKILNNDLNTDQKYIQRAEKCFGVKLQKNIIAGEADNKLLWDVVPGDEPANPYDPKNYSREECISKDDQSWFRVRFFIFDTGVVEGWACYNDDEQSCVNSGFEEPLAATSSSTLTTTTASATIEGDIGKNSDSVACAPSTKDLGVVTTKYIGEFKKEAGPLIIRLCQLSSIPGEGNDISGAEISGGAIVNSRVSGAWQALGQAARAAGVKLSSVSSFRLPDSCGGLGDGVLCAKPGRSPHQMGVAIDFAETHVEGPSDESCALRAEDEGNPAWDWLMVNAEKFGFEQYTKESWHWDPMPMTNRCNSSERAG